MIFYFPTLFLQGRYFPAAINVHYGGRNPSAGQPVPVYYLVSDGLGDVEWEGCARMYIMLYSPQVACQTANEISKIIVCWCFFFDSV